MKQSAAIHIKIPATFAATIDLCVGALPTFRIVNPLEAFIAPYTFDITFRRNATICSSEQHKIPPFNSIAKVMAPDGYLIIGATESITGLCPEFEAKRYLRAVFYQLRNGR